MDSVSADIRSNYESLTKGQKEVGKYVLEYPDLIALHTAKEIGQLTETSETTVIRFCYAIGYSGYNQLQTKIRKSILLSKEKESPLRKFREVTDQVSNKGDLVQSVLKEEISYITQNLEQWDESVLQTAIENAINANKIVVIGMKTSFSPAHWLYYTLNIIKGNAMLYRGQIDDANYLITEIDEDSLVIALSFPRYTEETITFVQAAKEKKAKVLGITDNELSPLGLKSDFLVKVNTMQPASIKGMTQIFSLLNVLITGIMASDSSNVQKRIQMYEQIEFL